MHDMTDLGTYVYKPLSQGCQTRVLELLPSPDKNAELQARLTDIDIYEMYDYKALSYTWGRQPKFTERLMIAGSSVDGDCAEVSLMLITKNLHNALVRFRDPYQICRIWVDAICINQGDNGEKSDQIPFMDRIYRTASRVLVWLGDSHAGAESLAIVDAGARQLMVPGIERKLYHHVLVIANLDWFTRRWVVQEVVLNVHVDMFCGSTAWIPWFKLVDVVMHLWQFGESPELQGLHTMANLSEANRTRVSDKPFSRTGVLDVLTSFSYLGCQEPEDRVYALAGLASDITVVRHSEDGVRVQQAGTGYVVAEYGKDPDMVYFDLIANNLARLMGNDRILQIASRRYEVEQPRTGISWVPDWRLMKTRSGLSTNDAASDGLDISRARASILYDDRVLKLEYPEAFESFGDATGYTPYARISSLSNSFPEKITVETITDWVNQTWVFLITDVSKSMGVPQSTLDLDFLLTQYERLLLERSDPLKHHQGSEFYDTFQSSDDFRQIITGPDHTTANNDSGIIAPLTPPGVSEETICTITQTMRGRKIFISNLKDTRSLPFPKKSSLDFASRFLHSRSRSRSTSHTPATPWPAIGVAASYAEEGDVVYTRIIEIRSWLLAEHPARSSEDAQGGGGGGRKRKTSSYGYFESQRSATFILRPCNDIPSEALTETQVATPHSSEAAGERLLKTVVHRTSSPYVSPVAHAQVADLRPGEGEQHEQHERQQHHWYIGECKTTRLLEVQPKGQKLDTTKLTGLVNQNRGRMQTILLR